AGARLVAPPPVPPPPPPARRAMALTIAPRLRGRLGRERRGILAFDDTPRGTGFVGSPQAPRVAQVGPATPDHTIFTKRVACFVDTTEADDPDALPGAIEASV